MLVVNIRIKVKDPFIEDFKRATIENAKESLKESGIARFDLVQENDDPSRFILVEAYRDAGAPGRHKETEHYKRWRDAVEPMMAEPRARSSCASLFPPDSEW
jgi:(4S)-4-hydroxy-5-phosphonooxypentane-2,3-dione isomerase